jgi:recombinase/recombinase-like zinc beta ribbon protein
VPIGYVWHREMGLGFDPDMRLQEAIRLIFARFRELGSARQVLLCLAADHLHFPRPSDGKRMIAFDWTPIRYRNVISVLKNPFYAGAYIYGKSEHRTAIVDGRAQKTYGHERPFEEWEVVLKDHHEGYIDWAEFERNQKQLAANAYGRVGEVKSGRGGQALLVGLLRCARCGRRLKVAYYGRKGRAYRCDNPNLMLGAARCLTFGSSRVDSVLARELLRAVEPIAVEAAMEAERLRMERVNERRRILELDLQKARYEASLAERRYAACDPDNRLIAAQLEKSWESALRRVEACQARLEPATDEMAQSSNAADFFGLAEDLEAAWASPNVSMRSRQQLLRALVVDIIADVDEAVRDVILTIHWRGGQHSQLRVRKPRSGEHGCRTPDEALAVIRSMAARWPDEHIAASLNRMGMRTGQGKTWTAHRVGSLRRVHGIHAYLSAEKDGEWLTMRDAAAVAGVTSHTIRRLIRTGVLPATQVVPDAPYQIRSSDLHSQAVTAAIARKGRPCRSESTEPLPMFPDT